MIQRLSHMNVYVLDQARAKTFYTEILGLEVRTEVSLGSFTWLTVGPKGQPDFEIALMALVPTPFMDEKACNALRDLIQRVGLSAGVFVTSDCQKTFEELSAKGVRFEHPPTERPYGLEALFKDDSGNWFSLLEQRT